MEADFFIFPRRVIMRTRIANKPSVAFVRASRVLLLGVGADLLGLWNAVTMRNAKGYDVTLLLFGVFAAVSVRKRVRDRVDGIPMTAIRDGLAWFLWTGLVFGRRRAVAAEHRFVQRNAEPERKRLLRGRTRATMPVRRPSHQDCPSSPKLRGRRRRRTVMPAAGFVC
ncbi:YiaA/YiaB family inner membrane protein [Xanthomonas translucens]|uniref:YiaA/YiaB family inner membrane protein n=2 Tax=Xanthomonas campestris pv. translucens TaxID=343 RepID=UPI003CCEC94D